MLLPGFRYFPLQDLPQNYWIVEVTRKIPRYTHRRIDSTNNEDAMSVKE
jgi:hypothetical protein